MDLYSDSKYVIDGITKWIHGCQKTGLLNAQKKPVLNADLWREMLDATRPIYLGIVSSGATIALLGLVGRQLNSRLSIFAVAGSCAARRRHYLSHTSFITNFSFIVAAIIGFLMYLRSSSNEKLGTHINVSAGAGDGVTRAWCASLAA